MNSFFDGYVNSKTSLRQFVTQYDNALRNKAEKEDKSDFACFHTKLPLVTDLHIEKQFAEVYTHDIMKKFQTELRGMSYCNVQLLRNFGATYIYEVVELVLARDNISRCPVKLSVDINEDEGRVQCLCSLFNFKGIVCRHMVAAMNIHGMHSIPETYILRRWRKDIRRRHTLIACSRDDRQKNPRMQNYDGMMKDTASLCEIASYSPEHSNWVKSKLKKMKEKVSAAVTSFIGEITHTSAKTIGLLSPHKQPRRGRPPTNRMKSTVEKISTKKV